MVLLRSIVIAATFVLVVSSCGKQKVQMSRDVKRTIDTTAAKELVALRPVLDSLCAESYDSLFKLAVDSLIDVRQLEIKRIVGGDKGI